MTTKKDNAITIAQLDKIEQNMLDRLTSIIDNDNIRVIVDSAVLNNNNINIYAQVQIIEDPFLKFDIDYRRNVLRVKCGSYGAITTKDTRDIAIMCAYAKILENLQSLQEQTIADINEII